MTAIIEKKLCVVCRVNEAIPNGSKPTCYDLICQIRYNDVHNTYTPKRCTKCGKTHTSYKPVCNSCEVKRKWK